ncbi:DUF928 domain-containing protein [Spirulina subsalsa FACHB-351]|uniref:DUF928 domain-containing protein n=1 Tax=Spirulina subsalsa FACHB-351 TaxID=234711 RepID=A0ABT3L4T9_9CYAN|nr:DUF928 domain-containing protein [Spirulina subsalsa]MCW6036521.1 DUF928 domain-containing protein [Spirulina subsalsa FACHB-351]
MRNQPRLRSIRRVGVYLFILLCASLAFPVFAQLQQSIEFRPPRRGTPSRTIPAGTRMTESEPFYDPQRGSPAQIAPVAPAPPEVVPVPSRIPDEALYLRGPDACYDEMMPPLQVLFPVPPEPDVEDDQVAVLPTGTTTQGNPSLFIYVPSNSAQEAELTVLRATDREPVFQEFVTLPRGEGVMEVPLPEILEPNQEYIWEFALICDWRDREGDRYIQGTLTRLPRNRFLDRQIARTRDSLTQAQIYAQNGAWLDTLAILAPYRKNYPELWSQLLESVGLTEVANQPFLGDSEPF